jgi:hypothetical protein
MVIRPFELKKAVTFLKNSNQKTFGSLRAVLARSGPTRREAEQSFFATFFSKKVVLTCFCAEEFCNVRDTAETVDP